MELFCLIGGLVASVKPTYSVINASFYLTAVFIRVLIHQNDSVGIDSTPLTAIIDGKTVSEASGAELNMGKPGVLSDFLKFCRLESSTDRYALMFWNHGGGTRSYIEPEYEVAGRHICEDADTGEGIYPDYLFMDEVQKALETAETEAPFTEGFDIISIDACIMATVEAAYELRNLASVYVSSMSNVAASGWNYEELFRRMTPGTGEASVEALSVLMVDTFKTVMSGLPDQSLSAVRCSELPILKTRIDALASALFEADRMKMIEYIRDAAVDFFNDDFNEEAVAQPYHDLNDLCWLLINNADYMSAAVVSAASGVLDALGSTVIAAYAGPVLGNYYGSGTDLERGLSIFFSKGNEEFGSLNHYASQYWYTDKDCSSIGPYGFIDFCTSDEDGIVESWREMHEAWYDPYKPEGYTPGSW